MDKALGGTLRLFVQKCMKAVILPATTKRSLSVTASLPNGTTLEQMNQLMGRMEAYLQHIQGHTPVPDEHLQCAAGGHTYLFHQSGRAKRIPLYAEKQDYQQRRWNWAAAAGGVRAQG